MPDAVPSGRGLHRCATLVLSAAMVVLGVAILVRTLAAGGGPLALGTVLGVLFVAAGAGRLYFTWRAADGRVSADVPPQPRLAGAVRDRLVVARRARSTSRSASSPRTRSA